MSSTNVFSNLTTESKTIFSLILHHKAMTKSELSGLSELKPTSLNRAMQPLIKGALIVEGQIGESTGGRKPVLFDVNPARYYIIGVDISRTYTQIVLTNLKMQVTEKFRFEMNNSFTPEITIGQFFK